MAQVFGEPGRNATDEAYKRFRRLVWTALLTVCVGCVIEGFLIRSMFPIRAFPPMLVFVVEVILLVPLIFATRWVMRKMDEFDRERMAWRKGAVGEVLTSGILEDLPDEYVVVHDVTKRFGNIDHIVIGPTGLFVVDTKNWKGVVGSNGDRELTHNGKSTSKPEVKRMLGAVMDFRSRVQVLTEMEIFIQGVMVFPTAHVEAKWGTTKQIHCLRDEQLVDYIKDQKFSKGLSAEDIDRIKRAVLQMAGMDERF